MKRLTDVEGRAFRLTDERFEHIQRQPEMDGQLPRIEETLTSPDEVRASNQDRAVRLYYRRYPETPVTEKHLLVVVRVDEDPFVVTAFFTDRIESGEPIDPE